MTRAMADWQALQGAITSRVILPGSPDYETVRMPAMERFANVRPVAVVLCASPADVAETITFARQAKDQGRRSPITAFVCLAGAPAASWPSLASGAVGPGRLEGTAGRPGKLDDGCSQRTRW